MFIFPDLGGATPNHRLAFPEEGNIFSLMNMPSSCCPQQLTLKLTFLHPFVHLFGKHSPSYVPRPVLGAKQESLCLCGLTSGWEDNRLVTKSRCKIVIKALCWKPKKGKEE